MWEQTGSSSAAWLNYGMNGQPIEFCGPKAKWDDKAAIAKCSKHVQVRTTHPRPPFTSAHTRIAQPCRAFQLQTIG